jgi:hypothetical protein
LQRTKEHNIQGLKRYSPSELERAR